MGDYKTSYSTSVSKIKQAAESDSSLSNTLSNAKMRVDKYGSDWESVNINDVVNKFAPGATPTEFRGKIIFNNGGQFQVVADVSGGYLRIQDANKKFTYVNLSGEYKPKSVGKSKWKQMTHYRIKKLEEM